MSLFFARSRVLPVAILLLALALRLWHVDFGLPALNDPDEPLFAMKALDMLRGPTLDPGWFGHPATTLFYALALVFALVGAAGFVTGAWTSVDAFAAALLHDPAIVILPGRLLIVLCGVACVYLTFDIGRRTIGRRGALVTAAVLAVSPLHVELSQIIRTDVPATLFMLLGTRHAVAVARGGGRRDVVLAAIYVGLAAATKWPAALVIANLAGAILAHRPWDQATVRRLALAVIVAVATLFIVSPFLFVDHAAVVRDLAGEARPVHLGATSGGFVADLGWYLGVALRGSLGVVGLALAAIGIVAGVRRYRLLGIAVLPAGLATLVAISAQSLIWERWAVPLLPFAALAAAAGLEWIGSMLPRRIANPARAVAAVALVTTLGSWSVARAREHADDTRQVASAWLRAHVPGDRTILIEHGGFDLFDRPGRLLFPLGREGCVDMRAALRRKPTYGQIAQSRAGHAIVDIGNVAPARLDTCGAEYAVFSNFTRYRTEAARFPRQLANYRRIAAGGHLLLHIAPVPGIRSGPFLQILQLRQRRDEQ